MLKGILQENLRRVIAREAGQMVFSHIIGRSMFYAAASETTPDRWNQVFDNEQAAIEWLFESEVA